MPNEVLLPKDKELATRVIDNKAKLEKAKVDQGFLGNIWGGSASIPNNIAALSVISLILTGVTFTFWTYDKLPAQIGISIKDFWSILTPLITLAIGYLFGDNKKKESN